MGQVKNQGQIKIDQIQDFYIPKNMNDCFIDHTKWNNYSLMEPETYKTCIICLWFGVLNMLAAIDQGDISKGKETNVNVSS